MNRNEKAALVSSMGEKLKKAQIAVVTEYSGLKVSEMTALRKELGALRGELQVVKNRLTKRALAGTESESLGDFLTGPNVLVTSEGDPVEVSKILSKFAKELEPLNIKGGFMGGKVLKAADIEALAKLPSKEELYAKVLGTLMAPASNLVRVLNGLPQKLVRVLGAIKDQKEKA